MKKHACPACGSPAFSFWQKTSVGPMRSLACQACGARVSVSWVSSTIMLAIATWLPAVGGVLAVAWAPVEVSAFARFTLGMVATAIPLFWLYDRVVKLVVR